MSKEKNIISKFLFSKKEYLLLFNINSLITLNDYFNINLSPAISKKTIIRIFLYGIEEYQKSIINYPDMVINMINNILTFIHKDTSELSKKSQKIYTMILNIKDKNDIRKIKEYLIE